MHIPFLRRLLRLSIAAVPVAGLVACSTPTLAPEGQPPPISASPWALQSALPAAPGEAGWVHQPFPGKKPTVFEYARLDGRDAIAVRAEGSASMLRHKLRIPPDELGQLEFSWKVPALMAEADLTRRDKADADVRVVLVFEGDRSSFSSRDALLSELARTLTGEELPYATLMYVWSARRPPESVLHNTRTGRIRKLVVETGPQRLGRWLDYRRDIRADYQRAFGEPPGALVGIGIMTDSDNTGASARAWYGPLQVLAAPPPR